MCDFFAGPWCVDCKNAKIIKNSKLFYDYIDYLPENSGYVLSNPVSGCFSVGYVCKNAINSQCPKGDFLC